MQEVSTATKLFALPKTFFLLFKVDFFLVGKKEAVIGVDVHSCSVTKGGRERIGWDSWIAG